MTDKLYQYRERWFGDAPPGRLIVQGEDGFIHKYIDRNEFNELFEGYVLWSSPTASLIGVYGNRKASRFRRILRERGARFEVVEEPYPESKISVIRKDYQKRLGRLEIDQHPEGGDSVT